MNGEPHAVALLRPIDNDQAAHEPIRALILAAFRQAEPAKSDKPETTAEEFARRYSRRTG